MPLPRPVPYGHTLSRAALQIRNMESQLRAIRESQEERVRGVAGEAGRLQEEVQHMRSATSNRLADLEGRRKAIAQELEGVQRCAS